MTREAPGSRVDRSEVGESARKDLEQRLVRALGRPLVAFDAGARALYAADSSNYRQVPLGVVYPRDADDVDTVLAECRAVGAPVLSRGAGTSLAGQTCNVAVVLDFSRHMNAVLEVDPVARLARVQPGVVLDDLRRAAERHGLTFGPDPATHAWCTLGGMVGNNSCGTHGLMAGKTVDNVERLTVHTYRGARMDVGRVDDEAYARIVRDGGDAAAIVGGLRELARRHGERVRAGFPRLARRVSGYNLDELLPENGFHVARSLVGTESTCVVVSEITVRLVQSPQHRRLAVLGYPDVFTAADAVPGLLAHPLIGLEGFDRTLVTQMRLAGVNIEHLELLPPGGGWLLAEVGADSAEEADAAVEAVVRTLDAGAERRVFSSPVEQRRVWAIRESGLGATARPPGRPPNLEGWEDGAVPPERLGEYLRGIDALWRRYGYSGAWYGHFGQGCVHTRNDFDLTSVEGLATYRAYVQDAARLCVSLGGSLSGEHGDGQARAELLETMYGAEVVDAFRQFKALWDPDGRMNPGKVVDPYPLDTNLKHGPDTRPTTLGRTVLAFAADGGSLQQAVDRCVGVGRCRNHDTGVMCPSYRATGEEQHSTRGRARLLAEMFRGEVIEESWRNEEVKEALDLCLSCKGCATDCPTHVDMASYKAEFLSHYYRGRVRPRVAFALGLIPWAARIATRVPRITNTVLDSRVPGRALLRAAGVSTRRQPPQFARHSLRRALRGHREQPDATVVLWPDTFTDAFVPEAGHAAIATLEALGERVVVPGRWACCGRPLYDFGMLDLARRSLRAVLDVLGPHLEAGLPVVVLEPSCLAVFRDEARQILPVDRRAHLLAGSARSLAEHVLALGVPAGEPGTAGDVVLQPHCQGRAVGVAPADRELLARLGYSVNVLDAGCCGLAGSFGFRAEHDELSRVIARQGVLPALERLPGVVVADGFSCATQIRQLAGRHTTTVAELLHSRLGRAHHHPAEAAAAQRNGASHA